MIPATQRPDGTWRKARKIRTGFNSRSGGATRYVPPAFRNAAAAAAEDAEVNPAGVQTRRLGEIAATDGRRSAKRFVDAALFLLTTTPVSSATTAIGPGQEGERQEASNRGGGSGGAGGETGRLVASLGLPLRSAARAAQAELGCDDCRQLLAESGGDDGTTGSVPEEDRGEEEIRDASTCGRDQIGGYPGESERGGSSGRPDQPQPHPQRRSFDCDIDGWWAKLRQADRGRLTTSNPEQQEGAATSASAEKREGEAWVGLELRLRASDVCCAEGQAAVVDFLKGRLGPQVPPAPDQEGDGAPQTGELVTTVLVAVLVFGRELSKRDRAELHGRAEQAGGVASASHGMGEERFLTLACGLGGRAGGVELELSPEKAEFARRLYRLAQQEYHSRYECLSHREIREVVALGGPNPEDHPDLYSLLAKQGQGGSSSGGSGGGRRSGSNARKKAGDDGPAVVPPSLAEEPSAERRGAAAKDGRKEKQQYDGNHRGSDAVGVLEEGEGETSPSKKGGEEEVKTLAAREVEDTTERVQALEKCPW